MHPSIPFVAPLLVLLSAAQGVHAARAGAGKLPDWDQPGAERTDVARQVSIEQRVTIRIFPRPAPPGAIPFDMDEDEGARHQLVERKFGKCLPTAAIFGVQPVSSGKLLLILRDNRLLTAQLKKGCEARDFYSGFIVAKSADGMICSGRDELRSRSGTACQVSQFRQLVEAPD